MFCGECGEKIETDEKFCGACGEAISAHASSQPLVESAVQPTIGKKKITNKLIGIVVCAIVLLVVAIGAIVIFLGTNNPEVILKRYLTAAINQDYNTLNKYSAYDFDNLIKEIYTAEGLTEKEFKEMLYDELEVSNLKELFDQQSREAVAKLKREFGNNYRISFEIINSSPLRRSEINSKIEYLENFFIRSDYDGSMIINLNKITEMVEYEVEAMIRGSIKEETDNFTIIMTKINGRWRVFDDINQFIMLL